MSRFLQEKFHIVRSLALLLFLALTVCVVGDGRAEASVVDTWYLIVNESGIIDSRARLSEIKGALPDYGTEALFAADTLRGKDVSFHAGTSVSLTRRDQTYRFATQEESVEDFLTRVHCVPGKAEMVVIDVSKDPIEISFTANYTAPCTITEILPYKTQRVEDSTLKIGTELVAQTGVNGKRVTPGVVTWVSGKQVASEVTGEAVETPAVDHIIKVGTKPLISEFHRTDSTIASVSKNADGSGTITLENGDVFAFSQVKHMTATAYSGDEPGVSNRTASGTIAHVGVVAVDRRVIPLGSKVYVVTDGGIVYGTAVAEDTGVIGNIIDLYMDTSRQCINFGRRSCQVYILK